MKHSFSYKNPKPAKTCAVLRYGGLGDAIQTSSILPWLKEQGYHITFYTVPEAWEVLKHDPHIDAVVIQDVDAVPNPDLGEFWAYTAKKYDRFINLSESVERSLLAMPGNTVYGWPHAVRNRFLNHNYLQFMHDIAQVPFPPRIRFYPTAEELAWAKQECADMRGKVIMWLLSGSAIHKTWGYLDAAIDRVLSRNDGTNIVLVGDASGKVLEAGWEAVPRVHCRSGKWTVRQAMTFAQVADLVIGPETGVMNAVALEPVPKIVTLSHSSVENLTRDWVNCTSLEPENTACYPCHRIHFNWSGCHEYEKTGIALCQANISLNAMTEAIVQRMAA